MPNRSSKELASADGNQVLQGSYNDVDKTLSTSGFLLGKVGRKIVLTISTTTVANDTESYAFSENGLALYTYTVIYTSGTRDVMLSAERTA